MVLVSVEKEEACWCKNLMRRGVIDPWTKVVIAKYQCARFPCSWPLAKFASSALDVSGVQQRMIVPVSRSLLLPDCRTVGLQLHKAAKKDPNS